MGINIDSAVGLQVGFDIRSHQSEGHEFGGLRPLHRALLPRSAEAWHMHALPLSVQHPSESSQPRLRGPLADGEGPAEWIASLKAARAANWPERKVVDKDP